MTDHFSSLNKESNMMKQRLRKQQEELENQLSKIFGFIGEIKSAFLTEFDTLRLDIDTLK